MSVAEVSPLPSDTYYIVFHRLFPGLCKKFGVDRVRLGLTENKITVYSDHEQYSAYIQVSGNKYSIISHKGDRWADQKTVELNPLSIDNCLKDFYSFVEQLNKD